MSESVLIQGRVTRVRAADILAALKKAGVRPGQTLVVHSSLFKLGRPAEVKDKTAFVKGLLDPLIQAVGPQGTLLFPTFSFSFCQKKIYAPAETPSETGLFGETVRQLPEFKRTLHPMYSYAVTGRLQKEFMRSKSDTCFGPGSIFSLMHDISNRLDENLCFLTIGEAIPPRVLTFIHHLEQKQGVPYRYLIEFQGKLVTKQGEQDIKTDFFARFLDNPAAFDYERCWEIWRENKVGTTVELGDSNICLIPENQAHDVTMAAMSEQIDVLCQGGWSEK